MGGAPGRPALALVRGVAEPPRTLESPKSCATPPPPSWAPGDEWRNPEQDKGLWAELYRLKDALRPHVLGGVRSCGVARLPEPGPRLAGEHRPRVEHVDVMLRATDGGPRAHAHGVTRCASPWSCPTCSMTLRSERAGDVVKIADWWRGEGGIVELATFTLRHRWHHKLSVTQDGLERAWRLMTKGNPWERLAAELGLVHWVRGADQTHGGHGWHPHYHALFLTRPTSERRRRAALAKLRERWASMVARVLGESFAPSWRGVDLRRCQRDEYLVKLGLEVTSPSTKQGRAPGSRTPWQIAHDAAAGDAPSLALWREYARAMKGSKQLTWSTHVRELAGVKVRSDEATVNHEGDDAPETHVARVPGELWDEALAKPGAYWAIMRGAERAGALGVAVEVAYYAWGLARPERGEPPDRCVTELARAMAPPPDAAAAHAA